MASTLVEKILAPRSRGPVVPGSRYHAVEVDLVLAHDATFTLGIERIERLGLPILTPEKLLFAADHFAPPSSPERAAILGRYVTFLGERALPRDQLFRGISHQLAVEDPRVRPGRVVVGADSHTTMVGALGCFATGFGTTDILGVLATGTAFLEIPPSIELILRGVLPTGIEGKDLALAMLAALGEDGALGHALELHDHTGGSIDFDARCAITNQAVEAGATSAAFVPDAVTAGILHLRDGGAPPDLDRWAPDAGANYARSLVIDVASLPPLVARPGSPADVVPVDAVAGEPIHQAFVGSCAGGRLTELEAAASILRGRRVAPGVRLVVTPASEQVWRAASRSGALGTLSEAGALVTNPSCGACGGIDKGLLAAGELCISTSNRNGPGRMGHRDGRIMLASAATVAASALTGRVTDPRTLARSQLASWDVPR
ncbi:MAG: 3-isopropylmalate dehydratase large subunit [Deltaproteobacteria bacterium]|nr:3-isopropylmalate dehydratase large subunit [Deltaproteobacteria bacterium]